LLNTLAPTRTIHLQPAAVTEELRYRLFAEDRLAEFVAVGIHPVQAEMLVTLQYRGRAGNYAEAYPQAVEYLVCVEDGTQAGYLLLDRGTSAWRIVDVAVLAAYRGQGIGGSVVEQVQGDCAQAGAVLKLHVLHGNPAMRLYERLGFRAVSEDAIGIEMECHPSEQKRSPGPRQEWTQAE
jgi:ribosomal protein S18 acetylase RimI-like enzyme